MRFIGIIVLSLLTVALLAQAPIAMGPGRMIQSIDYAALNPGAPANGDTPYYSAWLAAAAAAKLPVPGGLPIIGTANDGSLANIAIYQLDRFAWANPSNVHITLVNPMPSFGPTSTGNSPAGWFDYCSQASLASPASGNSGMGCSWKSREPVAKGGCVYLPVERQITGGGGSIHDATLVRSCDAGKTWANPYTVANSGTPSAAGDAPKPYGDPSYPGSIMWPAVSNPFENWNFFQFGQDGSWPAGVSSGCDPAVYTCAMGADGSLARAPNAGIMDVRTWTYYAGRIAGNSIPDGNDPANWTSIFNTTSNTSLVPATGSMVFSTQSGLSGYSAGTRVYVKSAGSSAYMEGLVTGYAGSSLTVNVDNYAGTGAHTDWSITPRTNVVAFGGSMGGNGDYVRLWGILGAPAYLKEFRSYLLSGFYITPTGAYRVGFMTAPQPWGPWKTLYIHDSDPNDGHGFPAISLAVGYTVLSNNPPVVRATNVVNGPVGAIFQQWEFALGRQPYGSGDVSAYTDIGTRKLNSGYVFGSGSVAGQFIKNGLVWAFDFMDHGGDTNSKYPFFHDVVNNAAILYSCYSDAGTVCGYMGGKGLVSNVDSISTQAGYLARYESRLGELSPGGIIANLNAPGAMAGNGTFSVVGVFRRDGATSDGPFWVTGTTTGGNTSVGLYLAGGAGNKQVSMEWGGYSSNHWRFLSSFVPVPSSWYFMASTVQANGATPIAHQWVGVGGTLLDKFAGVSYAKTGGNPPQTPNVTPGPLVLGTDRGTGITVDASYAGLQVFNRALSETECQLLYQTFRSSMLQRGITLQ